MPRVAAVVLALTLLVAAIGPALSAHPEAPGRASSGADVTDAASPLDPAGTDPLPASVTATPPNETGNVTVAAVYPDPVSDGDRGEFVVLDVAPGTDLGRYRLADDETTVRLPNVTAGGRVAVTSAPGLVRNLTDTRVLSSETPSLANAGEPLRVRRGNETVATARYRDAEEGRLARFDARGTVSWHPLGRTNLSVVTATNGTARAFLLPDAPAVPVETLRGAEDRVLLAGYTFTSHRVARALERVAARGVEVRVLLEGDPVDGITEREARLLDSLVEHGVSVRLLGGPRSRYAFHHAKYAVADDHGEELLVDGLRD